MNKWIILITGFIISLLLVWFALFYFTSIKNCPDTLSSDYYTCSTDTDCAFHPKYECMNNKNLNCVLTGDYSARQLIATLIECKCINSTCKTL